MTDIVERLKSEQVVSRSRGDKECDDVCGEAADEIERLRADNTRLRKILFTSVERRRMTDIVELLKMAARNGNALAGEAADEIERLEADNERLRAALVKISNSAHGSFDDAHVMADIARAALEAKDD